VKPENLMFSEGGIVKLMDFGLARATLASRMTVTGSALGTAAYMPPEATRGAAEAPGDVFALGVTLYEMLAGELPFPGDTPLALLYTSANEPPRPLRAARPDASPGVEELIGRMLAKDAAERPDSAAVARELALMTGVAVPVGVDPADEHAATIAIADARRVAPDPGRKFPRWLIGLLLVLMPVGALIALLVILLPGAMNESRTDRHTTAIALNNRGYEMMLQDSLAAARTTLEAALQADPRYPEAMLNLAETLRRSGDANGAAAWYGRVLREFPGDRAHGANAHFQLAEIDMASGAIPSAIEHYRSALAQDSTNVGYYNNLAFALITAGRSNDAMPVIRVALDRFPGEARLHKNLGLALLRSGAARDAITEFGAALERDASLASAWALRAEARAQLRDLPGARADWNVYLGMRHDEGERAEIEPRLRALGALGGAPGH
jgi:tetratricopeptide (TPR) repeat protein